MGKPPAGSLHRTEEGVYPGHKGGVLSVTCSRYKGTTQGDWSVNDNGQGGASAFPAARGGRVTTAPRDLPNGEHWGERAIEILSLTPVRGATTRKQEVRFWR